MNADAIIFDKDGTLIDFDSFWVTISARAMEDILKGLGRTDIPVCEILEAFGVHDGVTDIDGVLCKGTYEQMGQIVHNILNEHGCNISCGETVKLVIDAYNRNADAGEVKPTCPELAEVLTRLKKNNKKLAVVTTDNEEITRKCLKKLGIEELFDKIYTDDGKTPTKPNPYCAVDFSNLSGVKKERLVMVGDTMTDVNFAKNAGITVVCVAKTDKNKAVLSPFADAVISSLSDLLDILE
ncbi:MAG: HAD family hydrolase [Ruminococcaceae bacterium]|nr:HAD family hydrolase [Oscillospiraceae bacterium]